RQHASMTVARVLAVAADGEIRRLRHRGEELDQVTRGGHRHLAAVDAFVAPPARWGPGIAQRPGDDRCARRELGEPDVVEVAARELRLGDATRGTADGAESQPFACDARGAESDDANAHGATERESRDGGHQRTPTRITRSHAHSRQVPRTRAHASLAL